jgi:hypothetical protein
MNIRGQSTVELLISVSVLMITLVGVGWVFKAEWDRGKCVYFVFEKTHAALVVQNLPEGATGVALCGGSPETVSLPQLEPNNKIGSL